MRMHVEEIEGRDNHSGPALALDDWRSKSYLPVVWDADTPALTCIFLRRRLAPSSYYIVQNRWANERPSSDALSHEYSDCWIDVSRSAQSLNLVLDWRAFGGTVFPIQGVVLIATIVGDRRPIMVASEKSTRIDINTILWP